MRQHPAVLDQPEPLILVEALGAATVSLRIHGWVDGHQHSVLKVRSALIRLTKRRFENEDISMPDEAREVVFPEVVRIRLVRNPGEREETRRPPGLLERVPEETLANIAEGNLASEATEIERQAQRSRHPDGGTNLLDKRPDDDRQTAPLPVTSPAPADERTHL